MQFFITMGTQPQCWSTIRPGTSKERIHTFQCREPTWGWVRKMGNRDSKDDTPARQLFNAIVQLFIGSAYFAWFWMDSLPKHGLLSICVNSVFAFIKGFDPCEQVTSQFVEIVFACQNRNLTARRTFSRDVYSRHWPTKYTLLHIMHVVIRVGGVRREVGRLSFMLGVPPVLRAFGAATHQCVYEFGKGNGDLSTIKMSRKKGTLNP